MEATQWAAETSKKPVSYFISQINEQYGSFRNVTEKALEEELGFETPIADDRNEVSSDDATSDTPANDAAEIAKHKGQAVRDVERAHTEAAFGRDFVSFLLTRNANSQAALTISQPLKDRFPLGSIGEEMSQLEGPGTEHQYRDRLATGGLELEAFNSTVDSIVAAAERFEKEVRIESRYWRDLVDIDNLGWSVSRLARGGPDLGVRIGCLESGPDYRHKGIVRLKRSQDGSVALDLPADIAQSRKLRARIFHKGTVVASSSSDTDALPAGQNDLELSLSRASGSLFDEELFYEMSREASQLWNRGIKFTEKGIVMPLERDVDLVMDLAECSDVDSGPTECKNTTLKQKFALWPDVFAATLRILISHTHRMGRHRRAAIPRPMSSQARSRQFSSLLMPLTMQMQQQTAMEEIESFLTDIQRVLKHAKMEVSFDSVNNAGLISSTLQRPEHGQRAPLVERLASLLSSPTPLSFDMTFANIASKIRVMFRTHAGGSEYRYSIVERPSDSFLAQMPHSMILHSLSDMKEAVLDILCVCVVETIQKAGEGMWLSVMPQTGELQSSKTRKDSIPKTLRVKLSQSALYVQIIDNGVHDTAPSIAWTIDSSADEAFDLLDKLKSYRNF